MAVRSFWRLPSRVSPRALSVLPLCRRIHHTALPPLANHDISEVFTKMMASSLSPPRTERINHFMNTIYLHRPEQVVLFNISYRTQTERASIKGVRVGPNTRRAQKNVVIVSGLPLQHPSAISVNLYVAAMLSRISPSLRAAVSLIPLAHPHQYEQRLKTTEVVPSLFPSPSPSSIQEDAPIILGEGAGGIIPENISLEMRDTCKPIEAYVTRQNKYYVNIGVDMTTQGSEMKYKSNSLRNMASRGKYRFFTDPSAPQDPALSSRPLRIIGDDSMLSSFLAAPSLVLELKCSHALDDSQVVARGEEVIAMVDKLLE